MPTFNNVKKIFEARRENALIRDKLKKIIADSNLQNKPLEDSRDDAGNFTGDKSITKTLAELRDREIKLQGQLDEEINNIKDNKLKILVKEKQYQGVINDTTIAKKEHDKEVNRLNKELERDIETLNKELAKNKITQEKAVITTYKKVVNSIKDPTLKEKLAQYDLTKQEDLEKAYDTIMKEDGKSYREEYKRKKQSKKIVNQKPKTITSKASTKKEARAIIKQLDEADLSKPPTRKGKDTKLEIETDKINALFIKRLRYIQSHPEEFPVLYPIVKDMDPVYQTITSIKNKLNKIKVESGKEQFETVKEGYLKTTKGKSPKEVDKLAREQICNLIQTEARLARSKKIELENKIAGAKGEAKKKLEKELAKLNKIDYTIFRREIFFPTSSQTLSQQIESMPKELKSLKKRIEGDEELKEIIESSREKIEEIAPERIAIKRDVDKTNFIASDALVNRVQEVIYGENKIYNRKYKKAVKKVMSSLVGKIKTILSFNSAEEYINAKVPLKRKEFTAKQIEKRAALEAE